MNKLIVAFDIDGTLRCNCTETCRDTNDRVVRFAEIFHTMKNVQLIAWSGGGAQYAQAFIDSDARLQRIFRRRCYGKLTYIAQGVRKPDIAVDDIQDCELGVINLIVREK